ncbi:MAG: hypothetical protein ACI9JN_001791 [Bacteroidia bacterium]|jgi:hypothetical protein
MKKVILYTLVLLAVSACNQSSTTEEPETETTTEIVAGRYGDTTWTGDDAYDPASFNFLLGDRDSLDAILAGNITSACQAKGCWMKLDVEGMDVRVKFRDYGFFVPMNSAGHDAIVKGTFFVDSVSVNQLKEYAKDAEKTQEEIDAITDYDVQYTFIADGVIIK